MRPTASRLRLNRRSILPKTTCRLSCDTVLAASNVTSQSVMRAGAPAKIIRRQRARAHLALLGFVLCLLALGLLAPVSVGMVHELQSDAGRIARSYEALHALDALALARAEVHSS